METYLGIKKLDECCSRYVEPPFSFGQLDVGSELPIYGFYLDIGVHCSVILVDHDVFTSADDLQNDSNHSSDQFILVELLRT